MLRLKGLVIDLHIEKQESNVAVFENLKVEHRNMSSEAL